MLSLFKNAVYAETSAKLEEKIAAISQSHYTTKYPQFDVYVEDVCELKEAWSIGYRQEAGLSTRGHNTNNIAEAQFLVLKETLLQRVKEYNIVSLFEKLTDDLDNHYSNRLLSISSGSNDVVVARRYAGKQVKQGQLGFKIPSTNDKELFLRNIVSTGNDIWTVPSLTDHNATYTVDMSLGVCACPIGKNGAPCKHQYLLWSAKKSTSPNFLPHFSAEERKRFSMIATGSALPNEMYEGIHDRNMSLPPLAEDADVDCADDTPSADAFDSPDLSAVDSTKLDADREKAREALQQTFQRLERKICTGDSSYMKSLCVLNSQTEKMSDGELTSTLLKFGKVYYKPLKKAYAPTATSLLKKSQRFKINCQPTAVARRAVNSEGVKIGSKRAQPKGRSTSLLPDPKVPQKKAHSFSRNVEANQSVPSTHHATMKLQGIRQSKTKKVKSEKTQKN